MTGQVLLGEDVVDIQSFGSFFKSMPARLLENNLNINALRTNTLLRADEWRRIDERVVMISSNVLKAIADLRALGLVTQLGGLGVMLSQYEQVSDMSDANVNMARAKIPSATISNQNAATSAPLRTMARRATRKYLAGITCVMI